VDAEDVSELVGIADCEAAAASDEEAASEDVDEVVAVEDETAMVVKVEEEEEEANPETAEIEKVEVVENTDVLEEDWAALVDEAAVIDAEEEAGLLLGADAELEGATEAASLAGGDAGAELGETASLGDAGAADEDALASSRLTGGLTVE
jgi:hypothetical protein